MDAQFGLKSETTEDLLAPPDIFFPILSVDQAISDDLLDASAEHRGGRRTENAGRLGGHNAGLTVKSRLPNTGGAATMLKHMLGSVVTTGTNPYTHTGTPGSQIGTLKSASLQYGVGDSTETLRPFTITGSKLTEWTIDAAVGGYAELTSTWMGRRAMPWRTVADGATTNSSTAVTSATAAFTAGDVGRTISGTGITAGTVIASVTSATAAVLSVAATATGTGVTFTIGAVLATASYAAGWRPFSFDECVVSLNGTQVASANKLSLHGVKGLVKRPVLGSRFSYAIREQDGFKFDSTITADFDDYSIFLLRSAATVVTEVITFSNGTESLVFTTSGQIVGDPPGVSTHGVEPQTIKVRHSGTSDANTITGVLINTEATAA